MIHQTDVRGADEAFIRIRAIPGDVERQIRHIVDEAADTAAAVMLDKVPRSEKTDSRERKPHRTIAESIAVEKARYAPGGEGGGGFYEATAGPIDDPPSHLGSVLGGSKEFPVSPHTTRNSFHLMGYPGNFFMHRDGQEPQHEWIDEGIAAGKAVVETRIQTIRIDG